MGPGSYNLNVLVAILLSNATAFHFDSSFVFTEGQEIKITSYYEIKYGGLCYQNT